VRHELVEWRADQLPCDPAGGRPRRALENDTRILGPEILEREHSSPRSTARPGLEDSDPLLQEHVARIRGEIA